MRRIRLLLAFLVWLSCGLALAQDAAKPAASSPAIASDGSHHAPASPVGFFAGSRAAQREHEAKALAVPTPENARKWLREMTSEPHVAGTPADYRTALFVRDRLKEWGWNVEVAASEVLLNYPVRQSLVVTRPTHTVLNLEEAPLSTDKDSASSAAFGAFHGYGGSGDDSGQVVYVNYGRPEDFEALEKLGVTVKDRIVLVRYGGNFRGLKVLAAQKRGARGILIYSDPADDGYGRGDVYPAGPFRPGSAIQRGSVQFLSMGPGDPSTPRGPSTKDADRLPIDPAHGFPMDSRPGQAVSEPGQPGTDWERKTGLKRQDYFATIPSLPISYDSAQALLRELAGPGVPAGWQGGLPLAYHVGPGPVEVRVSVLMNYQLRTIWNVIATITGSAEPDRWVMVGNHRDAWVYGAVDPGSGTAATLEMCRAIGTAVKNGWKPRRTLVYANWDAEEYGLVGSTEWAEEHAATVDRKVALMLNVDSAVSGPELEMAGVPSLRNLVLDAAEAVTDVRTGRSLRETWLDARRAAWSAASPLSLSDPLWDRAAGGSSAARLRGFGPQLHPLGSGSDYTVFLDHLGVPCMDIGFSGRYGVYHSIYDNFTWMERFGDPEFLTHTIAARLYTLILMRTAAAETLPLRFASYGEALRDHVDELRLLSARRARAKMGGRDQAAPQSLEAAETFPGLPLLVSAVQAFQTSAERLDRTLDALASSQVPDAELARINGALTRIERAFLVPEGLSGRPWFKHSVYAPGLTTGYGAWPLPAIRQALEENKPNSLRPLVDATVAAIGRATAALDQAAQTASHPAVADGAPLPPGNSRAGE